MNAIGLASRAEPSYDVAVSCCGAVRCAGSRCTWAWRSKSIQGVRRRSVITQREKDHVGLYGYGGPVPMVPRSTPQYELKALKRAMPTTLAATISSSRGARRITFKTTQ